MAFSIQNKKGPISEINVTPFVDVMLVLLVIFMITAPMMFSGIKLKLPKTQKVNSLNISSQQVVVSLARSGEYYIGKDKILSDELIPEVKNLLKQRNSDVVYLRADYGIRYGYVAKLMSRLKKADIVNIALVTEVEKSKNE